MKEGWTYKKLGEVCDYHKEQGKYSGLPYIGMEHIESATGKLLGTIPSEEVLSTSFRFYKGEVLYGRLRPYLKKVYVAEFDGCCSTEIFPITSDCVDAGFIKYWLLTDKVTNMINATSAGCRMPRGNMNEVKKFDIGYPQDKQEQREIVAKLDTAFANIDALKANAEKQLAEARKLFQAELTECMRPKEGWEKDALIEVFNFIDYRGATPNKIQSGVPLVTAKNIKYGYIDYTIKDFISREEYETRKSRGVSKKGDILFTTEAPLGNVAIADLDEFSAGQRLITLQQYKKPKYTVVNEFYYYYMLGSFFQNRIKELATGATAQGIKAKLLKTVIVPIPPIEIQHQIVTRLDALSAHVRQLEEVQRKTLAECDALKQAMLREVFE